MRLAHIGYKPVIRKRNRSEGRYLSGMIGSHLHHCHLCLLRDAQQGERHSDVVVQIALRSGHTVSCRKHGTKKLFRSGLAVSSCQTYNRYAETGAVHPRQSLQRLQGIINYYILTAISKTAVPRHHGIRRSLVQGRLSEKVTVKFIPP